MSFANLAEASRQMELNRRMGYKTSLMGAQTQLQMAGKPAGGTMQAPIRTTGGTYGAVSFPDMFSIPGERPTGGGGGYAQQFPAMYNQPTGDMPGGEGATWERPDISFEEPFWGESEAWRAKQPGWVTGAGTVEDKAEQVVTAGLPSSAQRTESTIAEYLRQHGLDPTSTDPALMGRARELQRQWAAQYR
jgi:hypothetical protein